jgi:heptaprenyl diphosphate synthase
VSEQAIDISSPASERGFPISAQAFWSGVPRLHEPLAEVRDRVIAIARSAGGATGHALEQYVSRPGKMLRPALVLLGSWAGKKRAYQHVVEIAAAVETLHLATLIHDDVIDDADLRRGEPALHTLYGRKRAVLMGDFLFSSCFSVISNGTSRDNALRLAHATTHIVRGELTQLDVRRSPDTSRRAYLRRTAAKTAMLLGLSLVTGASESEAPRREIALLARLGYSMGMAFQIIDDILDFESNPDAVGKPVAADLKSGLYTLPVIEAISTDQSLERALTDFAASGAGADELIDRIRTAGGIRAARAAAARYTGRAEASAANLSDAALRDALTWLVGQLLDRTY